LRKKSFHFAPLIPEVNYTTRIEELPATETVIATTSLPRTHQEKKISHYYLSLTHIKTNTTYQIPVARNVSLLLFVFPLKLQSILFHQNICFRTRQTPPLHSPILSHFNYLYIIFYSLLKTRKIISSAWSKGELNYALFLSTHLRFHTKDLIFVHLISCSRDFLCVEFS